MTDRRFNMHSESVVYEVRLKKKNLKHGVFEDPYKTNVKCSLTQDEFIVEIIDAKGKRDFEVHDLASILVSHYTVFHSV